MIRLGYNNKVKIEDFEIYLKNLHPDLYSFSYILIPDDLQASQLIVDSLANVMLEKKSMVERILSKNDHNDEDLKLLKSQIFKAIFEIAKKRFHQIKSAVDLENLDPFYHLEFEERATVFLKHRYKINIELICFITNMGHDELVAVLSRARTKLCLELAAEPDLQGLL